ncbi:hypothetical protein JCM12296A_46960 [Desulfosarcina cetonica]
MGRETKGSLTEDLGLTVLPEDMKKNNVAADAEQIETGVALLSALEETTSQKIPNINLPEKTAQTSKKTTVFGNAREETLPDELSTMQLMARSESSQPAASETPTVGDQTTFKISDDFTNRHSLGRTETRTSSKKIINPESVLDDTGNDGQNEIRPPVASTKAETNPEQQVRFASKDEAPREGRPEVRQPVAASPVEAGVDSPVRFDLAGQGGRENQPTAGQSGEPSTIEKRFDEPARFASTDEGPRDGRPEVRQPVAASPVEAGVDSPARFASADEGPREGRPEVRQPVAASPVEAGVDSPARFASADEGPREGRPEVRQPVAASPVEARVDSPARFDLAGQGNWENESAASQVGEPSTPEKRSEEPARFASKGEGPREGRPEARQPVTASPVETRVDSPVRFDLAGQGDRENQPAAGQVGEPLRVEKRSEEPGRFVSTDEGSREGRPEARQPVAASTSEEVSNRDFGLTSTGQGRQAAPPDPYAYDDGKLASSEGWQEDQGEILLSRSPKEKNVNQERKAEPTPWGIDKDSRNPTAASDLDRQTEKQHPKRDDTGTKEDRFQFAKLASPSARVEIDKLGAEEGLKTDFTDDHFARSLSHAFDTVSSNTAQTTFSNGSPQPAMDSDFQKMVMDQVVDKAVIRSTDEGSEIRIQLKPDALGDVRMHITSENNQLAVKMVVDQVNTKEILESQLHHLKAELDRQGLIIDKIEVLVNTNTEQNQSREQFSQMSYNGGGRRGPGEERQRHQQQQQQHAQSGGSNPQQSAGNNGINYFA